MAAKEAEAEVVMAPAGLDLVVAGVGAPERVAVAGDRAVAIEEMVVAAEEVAVCTAAKCTMPQRHTIPQW